MTAAVVAPPLFRSTDATCDWPAPAPLAPLAGVPAVEPAVLGVGVRDSTYVLDGLLYHESDLRIEEHYTDTAGFTDHVFALMHLLGFRFAPRIRDLGDTKLYIPKGDATYEALKPMIGEPPAGTPAAMWPRVSRSPVSAACSNAWPMPWLRQSGCTASEYTRASEVPL